MRVRTSVALAVVATMAAACGATDDAGDTTRATVAGVPISAPSTTDQPSDELADDGVAPPDDDPPTDDDPPLERLRIDDALLPDDAFAPPWEPQRRQIDRIALDAGPNQTDCDAYWRLESLLGAGGGHAMWWIDGGNANHHVIRMTDDYGILAALLEVAQLAESCPTVNWNEGGSFTTASFDHADALGFRFDDEASGETTHVLIAAGGDLLSVLWMPLWTRPDGTMIDLPSAELERLAALMNERLAGARTDDASDPPATDPPALDPPVTDPPSDPPPDGVGLLLLDASDPIGRWRLERVQPYEAGATDDELLETCPAARAIERLDEVLAWQAEFSELEVGEAFQAIGEADDASLATEMVTQFAKIAACDFDVLIAGAVASGGPVEIEGADAAGLVVVELPDEPGLTFSLLALSVGPIAVVFSVAQPADSGLPTISELAALAAAKIAAA